MSVINRIALLLLIILIIAMAFWFRAYNREEFSNIAELNEQMKTEGFVQIGRFGKGWPAMIVETREQDDAIAFIQSNGQKQIYQGFEGYRLKMVRLNNRRGEEIVVVYRSEPIDAPQKNEQLGKPLIKQI